MARILIADDLTQLRTMVRDVFESPFVEVIEATDGQDAINKYRQCRPDGVLLDITMPGMDGVTVLEEIRRLNPEARVAMLTASGQEPLVVRAIQAGACDFVLKPFARARLEKTLGKLLAAPGSSLSLEPPATAGVDEVEACLGICGSSAVGARPDAVPATFSPLPTTAWQAIQQEDPASLLRVLTPGGLRMNTQPIGQPTNVPAQKRYPAPNQGAAGQPTTERICTCRRCMTRA